MKEADFTSKRLGKIIWEDKGMYYRFEPTPLPLNLERVHEIETQAQRAAIALGQVSGLMRNFSEEEIELFQRPFILKEAALSSEIEGTRSTVTDIYKEEKIKEPNSEKREDNQEVRNYRDALSWALTESPGVLTEEFIKELHRRLMQGVRGHDKTPGIYKDQQNAIGKREDSLDSAKFVPASPATTPFLMKNLVDFINTGPIDPLTKIAIVHYQFETIHPFRDGNGRIGRLLVTLQLCRENLLHRPLVYVSEYLNRNKDTYVDLLYEASAEGKIENLILFLLKAIETQAENSVSLLIELDSYKSEVYSRLKKVSKSVYLHELLDFIFKTPVFKIRDVKNELNITQAGAWHLVQLLKRENVVNELSFSSKDKAFIAEPLLKLFEKRK